MAEGRVEEKPKSIEDLIKWEKLKYHAPELTGKIEIPCISPNASLAYKSQLYKNKESIARLGYPTEGLIPNWKEKFLEKMDEILKKYRSVRLFMDICVRCGACTNKCHYFLGTGDPNNMPV
ncbi:MAG: hypothetical protein HGA78_06135, partial [Nitrospirales bacterium]|nr:hypothetical protein [Nitrospirales bacterium]